MRGEGRVAKRKSAPPRSNKIKHGDPAPRARRLPASPLSRLKNSLDLWEYQAADEMIAAFRMQNGLPVNRDADLDMPTGELRFDAADEHEAKRTDLVKIYKQWRVDLHGHFALGVTEAVIFVEHSLSSIDEHQRWRKGTAKTYLATGLRHFAALRGNTPRSARDWKYVPPTAKGKAA